MAQVHHCVLLQLFNLNKEIRRERYKNYEEHGVKNWKNAMKPGKNLLKQISSSREIAVFCALIFVCIFFSIMTPLFITPLNLFQVTRQMSVMAVIAIGMTFVIATGEIDISVGAIYNLAANIMALLIAEQGFTPWEAAIFALMAGLVAGTLNGVLSTILDLPSFIITLGTVSLYRGLTIMLSKGLSIGNFPENDFYNIGSKGFGAVPFIALIALIITVIGSWIFKKTVFSQHILAVGSNEEAAYRSGVQINIRKIEVMALNGLFCGIAAILGIAYLRSASPQTGSGYELSAIAATVVGGTPLQGGEGTIWGTLIGVALTIVIQNGLILMGLPVAWQIASTGLMILIAVGVRQIAQGHRL